jgi:hypothetical protein
VLMLGEGVCTLIVTEGSSTAAESEAAAERGGVSVMATSKMRT